MQRCFAMAQSQVDLDEYARPLIVPRAEILPALPQYPRLQKFPIAPKLEPYQQ